MPQLISYIDAIAREKERDVLYVQFGPERTPKGDGAEPWFLRHYHHDNDPYRSALLQWLDEQWIAWEKCGPFVTDSFCFGYLGDIYIDVPYDESDPQYQLVRDRIENPDGTMRDHDHIRWYYLPLEHAMKNAHQDESGYWERIGENL